MEATWDGRAISPDPPFGATVVVFRRAPDLQFLILHRSHVQGLDWAWTPPSGARQPGETVENAARRELYEEAGLDLPLQEIAGGDGSWTTWVAEAPADAVPVLRDAEHDRYEWVGPVEVMERCQPAVVSVAVARVVARLVLRLQSGCSVQSDDTVDLR